MYFGICDSVSHINPEKPSGPSFFPVGSGFLWIILKEIDILEAPMSDMLLFESLMRVEPTRSYGENTESPTQDYLDFVKSIYSIKI